MSKNKIFHFGNVGINQNNPTFMLDVNGETRINNNLVIGSGDKIYTKNSQGQLTIMGGATYPGSAIKFAGGQSGATDQGQMIFYAGTSTSLQEKLRIKSNGYVGINEDEPQARLDVKASGALGSIFRRDYQGASNTTTSSSKLALTIWGQDHDDSAYGSGTEMYGPMIGFGGRIDNAVPNTGDIRAGISYKYNGHLTFHTRAGSPGIADGSNERLRIDSNGRLIVGGGSSPSQVGDGQLIVYSSDRLHPSIKCAGTSSNNANGYSLLGDNYQSDESQLNLGVSYSGSGVVLSRSVKVSGSADDTYLSSQDSYATRPSAFKLDDDGSFVFLNTSTNANTAVDSAVNLAERLRIDSTGHVLVKGSNHEVRWYRDDGTRYGAITYDGGQFNIKNPYNDHTRITKSDGTELFKVHNNGNVSIADGNLTFASGHGIDFSATSNSSGTMQNELLEDYEEGTFTPYFSGGLVGSSYSHQKGVYTKIGRYVFGTIQIDLSTASTQQSSVIDIQGLPFQAAAYNTLGGIAGIAQYGYQNGFYNSRQFSGLVIESGTSIRLYKRDDGSFLQGTDVNGGREFRMDFSYHAA